MESLPHKKGCVIIDHFLKIVWVTSFILYVWGVMCSPLSHNYMVQLRSAQVSDSEENGRSIDQWESSKSDFGPIRGYEIPSSQNSISGYSQTTWNAQCCSYFVENNSYFLMLLWLEESTGCLQCWLIILFTQFIKDKLSQVFSFYYEPY